MQPASQGTGHGLPPASPHIHTPPMGLLEETVGAGHMTATLKQMRAARERRWRTRAKAECMITAAQRELGVKTKSSEEHGERE